MSRWRVRVVLLAAIALIGCATEKKDDSLERLAVRLAESIRSGDEAAFVRQHVQAGDMSPLYKKIEGVTIGDVDGDPDRRNLRNLTLRLSDGESDWLVTFAEGMNAQRGWVISGDLGVVVSREAVQ